MNRFLWSLVDVVCFVGIAIAYAVIMWIAYLFMEVCK